MEPKDHAYERFLKFTSNLSEDYWNSVRSEADVRMKIIDPILTDILGWPKEDIELEGKSGKGFIDYCGTIGGLNKLIVEAKRNARDLGLNTNYAGRYFKLNGSVFKGSTAVEGIEQAITYCGHQNAELACVTNGREWIIFRGNRSGDGRATVDGLACCFGSLAAVEQRFSLFYDLLSNETVRSYEYRAIFQEAEGQPLRTKAFRSPIRRPESRLFIPSDKIYADLDRIMLSFFKDLSGDDDAEARKACYVDTSESKDAEQNLIRVSENLRSTIRQIHTEEGAEITEAIKRVQEMKRREMVLLVGTKGAGKTTFIDRFFDDVMPQDLKDDCVVVRIDLAQSESDAKTIVQWLDEHFLEAAEKAAFDNKFPSYEDIVGMYFNEYTRLSEGAWRTLYKSDKDQFKIDFGKHIEDRREHRPHEYIVHLLHRIVGGLNKVPCLAFDNADHFDVGFQEEVFKFAQSLNAQCLCFVILPITDTTSWQLSKHGVMQSFHTDSFFLPTPPTEKILKRRIDYIEEKVKIEKPLKSGGYFFGRGMSLTLENINAFTACLQTVFLNSENVADWIGNLANQDIRRSLTLTRELMSSPIIKVEELLQSFIAGKGIYANRENIKTAIIKGKYDLYCAGLNSFVQNLFDLAQTSDTSPLLGIRILALLIDQWDKNFNNDSRYASVRTICDFFQVGGIEPNICLMWIEQMTRTGLVLSYDPRIIRDITIEAKIEISPSGRQHFEWALADWIYLESMAEVTPLLSLNVHDLISADFSKQTAYHRRSAISRFLKYLMAEDEYYFKPPKHENYTRQRHLLKPMIEQLAKLNGCTDVCEGRFQDRIGKVTGWQGDKAFGFISPTAGEDRRDVFLHLSEVRNYGEKTLANDSLVEYQIEEREKGPRAVNTYLI